MRKFFVCAALTVTFLAHGQMRWNQTYQQYIDQYKDIAISQMQRYHIPASITLAQGLLESGAGQSDLARRSNNHFGIKCNGWSGKRTYHDDDERGECFRAYDSVYDSYEDHSQFLTGRQRYQSLFKLKTTDYKGWARGLKAAGYATHPQYADRLISIIQLYKLYQYDTAKDYDHFIDSHAKTPSGGNPLHIIKSYNKNYYIIAKKGDSFKSIADEMGISYRKLASYNERDKRDVLEEGEVIWLKKKQKKAPKEYKNRPYIVRRGDSMYSIAQKYGIRLKSLYKKNRLSPDYQIRVGDQLKLR
jgi:LysM repeat protein